MVKNGNQRGGWRRAIGWLGALLVAGSVAAPEGRADRGASNRVARVTSGAQGAITTIRATGSRTPTFTVYKLERPDRIVVQLSGAELAPALRAGKPEARAGEDGASYAVNSWAVQRVAVEPSGEGNARGVRIVVSLARSATYRVATEGNDLVVRVTAREPAPAARLAAAREGEARARTAEARTRAAREEAARARSDADTARRGAEKAVEDARRMMQEAVALKKQATELAARARRDVSEARAEADRARAESRRRDRQAASRLAEAERMRSAAEVELAAARSARDAASASEKRAVEASRAAKSARADAQVRRREALAAARDAAQARAAAGVAAAEKRRDAAALARTAQTAARDAERRKAAAEQAVREAKRRTGESRKAIAAAEAARRQVAEAVAAAEARRSRAEAERQAAEDARRRAEAARQAAEAQARAAARRADELARAAEEATRRARAARVMRTAEEAALGKAAAARSEADRRREAAEKARAALEQEIARMRAAEEEAGRRRLVADRAARDARAAEEQKRSRGEISMVRAEARRLERERAAADRELAGRKAAVEAQGKSLAELDRARERAAAALAATEAAARRAGQTRAGEEKKLSELAAMRTAAEKDLAEARRLRAELAAERAELDRELKAARAVAAADKAEAARAAKARADAETAARRAQAETSAASEETLRAREEAARAVAEAAAARAKAVAERERATAASKAAEAARKGSAPQTATASKRTEDGKVRAIDMPPAEVASYGSTSGAITQQTVSQQRRRRVYRGRRVDLDVKDADIHNLMRLLAEVGGVNIVVPDEVKANVTVRLRDVPWDQAMEVILASKGLWYERQGQLIRVALRKDLEAEAEAEAARIRATAQAEAPEPERFTLNYADAKKLNDEVAPLLSPKGRILVDERTNTLIVSDIRAHRRRIIDLLTQLDLQTPQIQIEARIVEARSTFIREFGIQWGGNMNMSAAGGNATGLIFPNSVGVAGGAEDQRTPRAGVVTPSDFAVNLPAAVGTGSGGAIGLSLGSVGGNFNLNLRLSALEDTGSVRIISAPKITTSNNIQALIKSGTSIPISVISANGVQTQFVPADLALRVTPSVSQRDCTVSMNVHVTKNEADFVNTGARGDPSILTKEAQTTILVADGQTSVIGGIYTRNTGVSYSKVPFFGDLPVLGWFFKNRRENDERSEVLVFITPKITNRAFLRCQ